MPQVEINKTAPNFSLKSFTGQTVTLKDYQGKNTVLLVFNRGFT